MNFVEDVKKYALEHYEEDGWDVVVECFSDEEIGEIIQRARTKKGAIEKMSKSIRPLADHRSEIEATIF